MLANLYIKEKTLVEVKKLQETYPLLSDSFSDWLITYSASNFGQRQLYRADNEAVYNLNDYNDYLRSIIHYLSSMTDNFIIRLFNELTKF